MNEVIKVYPEERDGAGIQQVHRVENEEGSRESRER